ncbi:MAG: hypothetical protein ACJA04_000374 [Cellvibrionaceae bacterium]|jgi:hypothetical protein
MINADVPLIFEVILLIFHPVVKLSAPAAALNPPLARVGTRFRRKKTRSDRSHPQVKYIYLANQGIDQFVERWPLTAVVPLFFGVGFQLALGNIEGIPNRRVHR